MCVIFIINKSDNRPTDLMLDKAYARNGDGIGLACREKGEVFWKKGMKLDEAKEMIDALPVPFVVHFRRASSNGGGVFPELCHPFPIDEEVSLELEGHTKGYVLFHNGDVKDWKYELKQARATVAGGRWSDSRALARLTQVYGLGYMGIYQDAQRGVAFGPKGTIEVYVGPGWTKINDIWCSNDHFWNQGILVKMCHSKHCVAEQNLDANGWCPLHRLTPVVGSPKVDMNGSEGVPAASPLPFRRDILRTKGHTKYQGPLLSLADAELMETAGKITKNLLKAIRKAHYDLAVGGKEAERATRVLSVVSQQVYGTGQPA